MWPCISGYLSLCADHRTWEILRPEMKASDSRDDLHFSISCSWSANSNSNLWDSFKKLKFLVIPKLQFILYFKKLFIYMFLNNNGSDHSNQQ